jgi:antitoxin component YwqK of YwqJK toxin-antitoxin module
MKYSISILILLGILAVGCAEERKGISLPNSGPLDTVVVIPDRVVDLSELDHDKKKSLWRMNGEPYSGYAVGFHQDSTLSEKVGFYHGRKHGQAARWFPDGHLRQIRNYRNGKLHGEKKMWASDGEHVLIAALNYQQGKAHGEQRTWYPTGELYKVLNLSYGKEEGIQRAFRENGQLYANYEAKNGRIFGLKKAALCYGLEDENLKNEK